MKALTKNRTKAVKKVNKTVADQIALFTESDDDIKNVMGEMLKAGTHDGTATAMKHMYQGISPAELYDGLMELGIMKCVETKITRVERKFTVDEEHKKYFTRASTGYRVNLNTLSELKKEVLDKVADKIIKSRA